MTDAHPRMALGTMHFGTRLSATQSREIFDAYLDLGGPERDRHRPVAR